MKYLFLFVLILSFPALSHGEASIVSDEVQKTDSEEYYTDVDGGDEGSQPDLLDAVPMEELSQDCH